MNLKRNLIIFTIGLIVAASPAMASKNGLDYYFKKPEYAGFQVSPNGKELAALVPVNTRMNIIVIDLATREGRIVTSQKDQDVSGFMWATDERLLFFMDKDGSESFGIFAVNTDGSMPRVLSPPVELQMAQGRSVIRITSVIDRLKDDPEHVLVSNNERRAAHPDVYKMNIVSGRKSLVQRNPGNVNGWFVNYDGEVMGAAFTDDLYGGFLMLNDETGEWEEIVRAKYDEYSFSPVAIKGNGDEGYISSYLTPDGGKRDKAAIYEYNFKTRKMGNLIFEHPKVDVTGAATSDKTRDIIAIGYAYGIPEVVYVDQRWAEIMAGINAALPDTINSISSTDEEETIGVVTSYSSTQSPVYYLYDFEKNSMEFLADSRPWAKAEDMSEIKSYTVKARDGMELQAYLTVPKGSDGKNLPTVVHPHGGPWARDGWGFNPEIQFLASRGYAVLQVNFRGSTGFGREHWLSSRKQWGQSMQTDITDALKWAVDEGVSDPERVCIYGGSYGGYATMAGLTFTPELYKCGINYVGVTDLPLLFKTAPDSWASGIEQMQELVGNPKVEMEFLEEWSPSKHADKIKAPVFMAYGLRDPRVNIKHARVMEDAMDEHNVKYETMIKKDEGHGYRKQENQYDFYGRMETFLAENLNP